MGASWCTSGDCFVVTAFHIVVNVIMENARESLMCYMCADDLVLMSESVKNWREKFLK